MNAVGTVVLLLSCILSGAILWKWCHHFFAACSADGFPPFDDSSLFNLLFPHLFQFHGPSYNLLLQPWFLIPWIIPGTSFLTVDSLIFKSFQATSRRSPPNCTSVSNPSCSWVTCAYPCSLSRSSPILFILWRSGYGPLSLPGLLTSNHWPKVRDSDIEALTCFFS